LYKTLITVYGKEMSLVQNVWNGIGAYPASYTRCTRFLPRSKVAGVWYSQFTSIYHWG